MKTIFKKRQREEHHGSEGSESELHAVKYICPMECEGDKTYDEPGKCPVCKMNLVPVGKTAAEL
jgi:Cu+-exporting ATPase